MGLNVYECVHACVCVHECVWLSGKERVLAGQALPSALPRRGSALKLYLASLGSAAWVVALPPILASTPI